VEKIDDDDDDYTIMVGMEKLIFFFFLGALRDDYDECYVPLMVCTKEMYRTIVNESL